MSGTTARPSSTSDTHHSGRLKVCFTSAPLRGLCGDGDLVSEEDCVNDDSTEEVDCEECDEDVGCEDEGCEDEGCEDEGCEDEGCEDESCEDDDEDEGCEDFEGCEERNEDEGFDEDGCEDDEDEDEEVGFVGGAVGGRVGFGTGFVGVDMACDVFPTTLTGDVGGGVGEALPLLCGTVANSRVDCSAAKSAHN
jgi:hypothetical protein